jgi:hypothetical protein
VLRAWPLAWSSHWAYRVHMFSNALGLSYTGEAELSLIRAQGYLELRSDDRSKGIVKSIKEYFEKEPKTAR